MPLPFGASPEDWTHFDLILGLTSDLLPVVSNPKAKISPRSKLKSTGKTPSIYNDAGFVVGIRDWTHQNTQDHQIVEWSTNSDYGICVQTRHLRAFDVDVDDPAKATPILAFLLAAFGPSWVRYRGGVGRVVVPVYIKGNLPKRVLPVDGGALEFLGTGQQFVAVGTHPSGKRYLWGKSPEQQGGAFVDGLPETFPSMTVGEFETLWGSLQRLFGVADAIEAAPSARLKGDTVDKPDALADFLWERDLVHSTDKDGALVIECPWVEEHTGGEEGDGSTVYFPAGTNGYEQGHFKCLHAHCASRTDGDFQLAIGYDLDDFEVLPPEPDAFDGKPADAMRFAPIPAQEFSEGTPPGWIIKGLIPKAELVVMFGESGSGKSFLALDMAAAIARGEAWRDMRTRQGRVVYVAAEGSGGFRNRLKAYAQHHQVKLSDFLLSVIPAAPNLLTKDDALDVAKAIVASGGADVIVVDTFAQVTPGANENAAEDMGKALSNCKGIHRATGAVVLLVHHAGKDTSRGARGWSGLKAAADAEIEVIRTNAGRMCRVSKQKDAEDGKEWGFELSTIPVGVDEDGDVVESCVVLEAAIPTNQEVARRKLGPWEKLAVEVVTDFSQAQTAGIELEAVIEEALRRAGPPEDGKRDTRRQRLRRALLGLSQGDDAPYLLEDGCLSIM